ncbi:MAG: hypothetical protein JWP22_4433, partial [Ramlibacter sp.]|nr:hypothetical protein [Ramlibacter sp.]
MVAVTGALVLAGWALDIELLKSVPAGAALMKANTAAALLLAGAAVARPPVRAGAGRWLAPARGAVVA